MMRRARSRTWALLVRLHRSPRTRPLQAGAPRRLTHRLARSERGNVTLLYVFFAMVLYCSIALVWNTGRASTAAIHAQTTADSAAYMGALWTSRAMNVVTATNMLILKNICAMIIQDTLRAAIPVSTLIAIAWMLVYIARIAASLGADAAAWAGLGRMLVELMFLILWAISASPGLAHPRKDFQNNVRDLKAIQDSFVNNLDGVLKPQLDILKQESGCPEIYVTTPGLNGKVQPPLKPGDLTSIAVPLLYRLKSKDDNWASYEPIHGSGVTLFALTPKSYSGKVYLGFFTVFTLLNTGLYGHYHHDLTTSLGPVEWGPITHKHWRDFSVVAVASVEGASQHMVARGLFSSPLAPQDKVLAYAQAETYNGVEQLLGKPSPLLSALGSGPLTLPLPFRVWSTMGWQWQPRLTRGEHLAEAIVADRRMRALFRANAGPGYSAALRGIRALH